MTVVTITTTINPPIGTHVWVITTDRGIIEGTFVEADSVTYLTAEQKKVGVNVAGGLQYFDPADVYDSLHEAVTEYETRLS